MPCHSTRTLMSLDTLVCRVLNSFASSSRVVYCCFDRVYSAADRTVMFRLVMSRCGYALWLVKRGETASLFVWMFSLSATRLWLRDSTNTKSIFTVSYTTVCNQQYTKTKYMLFSTHNKFISTYYHIKYFKTYLLLPTIMWNWQLHSISRSDWRCRLLWLTLITLHPVEILSLPNLRRLVLGNFRKSIITEISQSNT